jgi:hypothetical protein
MAKALYDWPPPVSSPPLTTVHEVPPLVVFHTPDPSPAATYAVSQSPGCAAPYAMLKSLFRPKERDVKVRPPSTDWNMPWPVAAAQMQVPLPPQSANTTLPPGATVVMLAQLAPASVDSHTTPLEETRPQLRLLPPNASSRCPCDAGSTSTFCTAAS